MDWDLEVPYGEGHIRFRFTKLGELEIDDRGAAKLLLPPVVTGPLYQLLFDRCKWERHQVPSHITVPPSGQPAFIVLTPGIEKKP